MPREETSWPGMMVVVLHFQFHLKLKASRWKGDLFLQPSWGKQYCYQIEMCDWATKIKLKPHRSPTEDLAVGGFIHLGFQTDVFRKGAKRRPERRRMEVGVRQGRWARWHEPPLHKNTKEASIHLHLSLLVLALTFQHWQVKSSVSVWRDAM